MERGKDMNKDIRKEGIIAIMRGIPYDKLISVAQALYDGGIRIIECTFEQEKEEAEEIFKQKIQLLKNYFGDKMMIGAGTVLTESQVQVAYEVGCELIITPNTNRNIIAKIKENNMIAIIGALTPSEIVEAKEAGADFVKVFPAGNLGVKYFSSIKAPLSHIPMLAVGSIGLEEVREFTKAGVLGFGIGSPLVPPKAVEEEDYVRIQRLAEEYVRCFSKSIVMC